MGYGSSKRQPGNYPACANCGSQRYWRDDCSNCKDLPIRWCFGCERTSQTEKAACLHCDKAYGPMVFGYDRLPEHVAADAKGWGKNVNPFRTSNAKYLAWIRKSIGEVTLRSCFVCGNQFQLGSKASAYDLRERIVPAQEYVDGEWVPTNRYLYDRTQKAHRTCGFLPDEEQVTSAWREDPSYGKYEPNRVLKPVKPIDDDQYVAA